MEFIKTLVETINENAGIVAFLSIIVSVILYRMNRRSERKAMQNELEAMNEHSIFPMSESERPLYIRKRTLEKNLKK